jgi:uncharacterized protein (DUF488 family)
LYQPEIERNPLEEGSVKLFTIGYGGRTPTDFVALLRQSGVATLVDVRIDPRHAHLGSFVLAKSPDKGIQRLLWDAGIAYVSIPELGNPFRGHDDWKERYERWLRSNADVELRRLEGIPEPFCLLCAEKDPENCHRKSIADVLRERGHEVTDLI